jgi:DNA polymerase III delta prime subunit
MTDDILFVEKYRPKTIKDCILSKVIKDIFQSFVEEKKFPNLLLSGTAGTGKTTVAKALCNELDYDYIMINASDERNIDMVRNTIKNFASVVSLTGRDKAIILDESDGLNPIAQGALRGCIEQYPTVRFILTCNFKNKIIEPIQSRLSIVEFNIKTSEKKQLQLDFVKRVFEILTKEKIEYDPKAVVEVVKRYFPDNRKVLNDIQKYSAGGKIDSGILASSSDIEVLVGFIKDRDLGQSRQWIVDNLDTDTSTIFRQLYDSLYTKVKPEQVPNLIPLIGQWLFQSEQMADQEIARMCLISEIFNTVEFK